VDSQFALQIGDVLGGTAAAFHGIDGVAQLTNGSIVVLERATQEVRFFSRTGAISARVGRRGNGPNEFAAMLLVPAVTYDSIVILDGTNRRVSVLSLQGEFLASYPLGGPVGAPKGMLSGSRLVGSVGAYIGGREGVSMAITAYMVADLRSGSRDTVAVDTAHMVTARAPASRRFFSNYLPFDSRPSMAVGRGVYYFTWGNRGEILEYNDSGALRRMFRVRGATTRVSQRDFDDAVESFSLRMADPALVRGHFGEVPRPEYLPVWDRLLVDELGFVWAALHPRDVNDPPYWSVFGPNGDMISSVVLPLGLDLRQVGESFVLGVWRDSDGVEYVRKHRLHRGAGGQRRAASGGPAPEIRAMGKVLIHRQPRGSVASAALRPDK
jgi:hypothetical protein